MNNIHNWKKFNEINTFEKSLSDKEIDELYAIAPSLDDPYYPSAKYGKYVKLVVGNNVYKVDNDTNIWIKLSEKPTDEEKEKVINFNKSFIENSPNTKKETKQTISKELSADDETILSDYLDDLGDVQSGRFGVNFFKNND